MNGGPETGSSPETVSRPFDTHPTSESRRLLSDIVSSVPCTGYEEKQVYAALCKALADIEFAITPGIRVLLKPNIIAQNTPGQAATTHPAIVAALCRFFREAGCAVSIGDSSAFHQRGGTLRGMYTSGMIEVAGRYGASLIPFEKASIRKITTGKALNPFWITEAVFEHDLVVNVPKLKVHRLARYTGAIKNMFGCIPGGTKQIYHEMFQKQQDFKEFWGEPIVDIYTAANPGLTVMDAVYGLDVDGPAATGTPRATGVILASLNGTMVDVAACRMIGFEPRWVPAVRAALERGMAHEDELSVSGTLPFVPYRKLPDTKPSKISDFLFHQVIMRPQIDRKRCEKGCAACIAICKPHAARFDEYHRPVIDYDHCIRCYRCAEQCPYDAVSLHGSVLNHVIGKAREILEI